MNSFSLGNNEIVSDSGINNYTKRCNAGRWAQNEYEWFVEGISKYKNNLKCIQKNIRTRKAI